MGIAAVLAAALAFAAVSKSPSPLPLPVVPAAMTAAVAASSVPAVPPANTAEAPVLVLPVPSVAPTEHPAEPTASAAELFARANAARRDDKLDEATRLYRALQTHYPSSPEAATSRVTLGRLLLDRKSDAPGALAEFDAYLSSEPDGTMRQEALVGRAGALGRLGRTDDERSAWNTLLSEHPDTIYADRARARLKELH